MTIKRSTMQLKMLGLPVINSLYDFSKLTHLSKRSVFRFSSYSEHFYREYELPKKGGGVRLISQPNRSLKAAQAWILRNILDGLHVSAVCKGFEKGENILSNARPHQGANVILNLDLENFFPSVKAEQVCSVFKAIGYNPIIAGIFTSMCTYNGKLPQGAPTSPKLSNLTCLRLDNRLQGYVGKKGIVYTRYADDLSFSSFSQGRILSLLPMIKKIIKEEGFEINGSKTRIWGPSRSKKVTGLVICEDKAGIGRKRLHEIRAKIHKVCFLNNAEDHRKEIEHIKGWLAFVKTVDEDRWKILNSYISSLKVKYPKSDAIGLLFRFMNSQKLKVPSK